MYHNSAAEIRPELQAKVEEAMAIDKKFIAELIFPAYPGKTRTGDYRRIKRGKGQLLTNPSGNAGIDRLKRAPGTAYPEMTRTSEKQSWNCTDRGIEEPMDDGNVQDERRFFEVESATAIW